MSPRKTLERILAGSRNVSFGDMRKLVEAFGFRLSRVRGFNRPDLAEPVNLQAVNGQAKPYQIRQFLKLVEEYNLRLEDKTP